MVFFGTLHPESWFVGACPFVNELCGCVSSYRIDELVLYLCEEILRFLALGVVISGSITKNILDLLINLFLGKSYRSNPFKERFKIHLPVDSVSLFQPFVIHHEPPHCELFEYPRCPVPEGDCLFTTSHSISDREYEVEVIVGFWLNKANFGITEIT